MARNGLNKLYAILRPLLGDDTMFNGLSYNVGTGVITIDNFPTEDGDYMFIAEFYPFNPYGEPVIFAAKGMAELKEQLEVFVGLDK